MKLFGIEVNSFGLLEEATKTSYSATDSATGKTWIIVNDNTSTKHADLTFYETLPDLSAYTDSSEAKFQEGIDAIQAGLAQ
jgi:hypothetical protein